MRSDKYKPLYRKVNTRARGMHHIHGGDYRHSRGSEPARSMHQGVQRGLDYTPLFRFLLSRVGHRWDEVHSEAVSRLDKQEPIYWMVALNRQNAQEVVRIGESTYFSGLYVDDHGLLQIVAPEISADTLEPQCACCTHTFNGVPFTKTFIR